MLNAEAEEGRERKKPPNPLSWKVYAQPDVTRSARHGRRRLWRADVRRVLIHFHVVVTDAGLLGASNWIRQRRTNKIQEKKNKFRDDDDDIQQKDESNLSVTVSSPSPSSSVSVDNTRGLLCSSFLTWRMYGHCKGEREKKKVNVIQGEQSALAFIIV